MAAGCSKKEPYEEYSSQVMREAKCFNAVLAFRSMFEGWGGLWSRVRQSVRGCAGHEALIGEGWLQPGSDCLIGQHLIAREPPTVA